MKDFLKKFSKVGYFFIFRFGDYEVNVPLLMRWSDPGGAGLSIEVRNLIDIFIGFGSIVAVVMIIISGYTLITSAGDPDKAQQGQKTLTGAIIGLIVVWAAGLIIKTILQSLQAI